MLADSHGVPLSNMLEQYGIYNFSFGSDSYFDMYRKIKFLSGKTNVRRIFISADEHTLSPYREKTNNMDRSLIYASKKEFKSNYMYIKEKFIKKYIVFFQPKIGDVIQSYMFSKLKNAFMGGGGGGGVKKIYRN
jgi:hypothetical protein